jgi:radical SAM superfamily enzyme YgiQ (UPF0313 family)
MNNLETKPCRRIETYCKLPDGSVNILAFSAFIKLDPIAGLIWELANGKRTVSEIVKSISNHFQNVENSIITNDVVDLLENLNKKSILVLNWDPLYKNNLHPEAYKSKQNESFDHTELDVLFVQAPSPNPTSILSSRIQGMPPLGLGYLATWVINKGYSAKIIDLLIEKNTFLDIEAVINTEGPKIIAISSTTETYNTAIRLAALCKEVDDNLIIVMGGSHVTFEDTPALETGVVDIIVRHEGEIVFGNICDSIIRKMLPIDLINGITYINEKGIVSRNPKESFIENLNEIPYPNRDLFEINEYRFPGVISTSRGCVGRCIFCAAAALSGGQYRIRDVDNIVEEMKYLKNKGVNLIYFVDDTVTADIARLVNLMEKIIDEGLSIPWGCESRVDVIDKTILELMKKAGCISLQFGVEAGSQEMLDSLKKNISIEQIENVFKWCQELGIVTSTCIIIGQPFDTLETVRTSIDFALELQSYGASVLFSISTPFPGTYMYNQRGKLGISIVESNFDYYNTLHPIYNTEALTVDDMRRLYIDGLVAIAKNENVDDSVLEDRRVREKILDYEKY